MPELTPERLREIEARCEAATEAGPEGWGPHEMSPLSAEPGNPESGHQWYEIGPYPDSPVAEVNDFYPNFRANAEFLGHARTDIPDLLAALKQAREERDGFAAALYWYAHPETWRQWPHADQGDRARIALSDPAECLKARDAEITTKALQHWQAAYRKYVQQEGTK